jgi:hypothetical protein
MMMLQCDLCEKQFDPVGTETFFIEVTVPSGFHEDNEPRRLDVCSPACLGHLASFLEGDEEPSPDQDELPIETPTPGLLRPATTTQAFLGTLDGEVTVR